MRTAIWTWVLHFSTQAAGLTEEDTEATLTGQTEGGVSFAGTDSIRLVPSSSAAGQGRETAPGQLKEPGESATGKAFGKESAPGQNKIAPEEEKDTGKSSAPGQNKDDGQAEGKGKNKDK